MGYTTDFSGSFTFNKELSPKMLTYLKAFNETRRMQRNVDDAFGIQGEFYAIGGGSFGQNRENNIVDYNTPPKTQPGLWCQWVPTEDGLELEWDGGEKFYNYSEWLFYLINKIIAPNGYVLNGEVEWSGEEVGDNGTIVVDDNKIFVNGVLFTNDKIQRYKGYGEYETTSMELETVLLLDNIEKLLEPKKKVTKEGVRKALENLKMGLITDDDFKDIIEDYVN